VVLRHTFLSFGVHHPDVELRARIAIFGERAQDQQRSLIIASPIGSVPLSGAASAVGKTR
jgi:hypothetical protein